VVTDDLRHYCRNPRCKMKLAEPVENIHFAFCSPSCHASFYRRHCLVCEQELAPGPDHRKFCKKPRCKSKHRQFPHVYDFPGHSSQKARRASETPIKSGSFWCDKEGRGWRWEVSYERWQVRRDDWEVHRDDYEVRDGDWEIRPDEHRLLDRDGKLVAGFVPAQTGYRIFHPWTGQHADTFEAAKRMAISLALANLPLEPKFAERIARLNELPSDPPQYLLPHTATYLAGLAAVAAGIEAPSIAPDGSPADTDLELRPNLADIDIPTFLLRTS
jgi:hypothetical protein